MRTKVYMVTVAGRKVYYDPVDYRTYLVVAHSESDAALSAVKFYEAVWPADPDANTFQVWPVNVTPVDGQTIILDGTGAGKPLNVARMLLQLIGDEHEQPERA